MRRFEGGGIWRGFCFLVESCGLMDTYITTIAMFNRHIYTWMGTYGIAGCFFTLKSIRVKIRQDLVPILEQCMHNMGECRNERPIRS